MFGINYVVTAQVPWREISEVSCNLRNASCLLKFNVYQPDVQKAAVPDVGIHILNTYVLMKWFKLL